MFTVAELINRLKRYPPTMRIYLAHDPEGLMCHELDTVGSYHHSLILYPNHWQRRQWTEVE